MYPQITYFNIQSMKTSSYFTAQFYSTVAKLPVAALTLGLRGELYCSTCFSLDGFKYRGEEQVLSNEITREQDRWKKGWQWLTYEAQKCNDLSMEPQDKHKIAISLNQHILWSITMGNLGRGQSQERYYEDVNTQGMKI